MSEKIFTPARVRCCAIVVALTAGLVACGGGGESNTGADGAGGGGNSGSGGIGGVDPGASLPPSPVASGCTPVVTAGYRGPGIDDNGLNEGQGGGVGEGGGFGGGAGGSGDGGIGVGGGLGQFRNALFVVSVPPQGEVLATGVTDAVQGMATVTLCGYQGPLEFLFAGREGAEYFDEALEAYVPFPAGKQIRARVANTARSFAGVTVYTEAAVRLDESQGLGVANASGVSNKAIGDANQRVASILADQLPGEYRSSLAAGRFEITGLPVILNDANIGRAGTIPDNNRGRYGAATAGLSLLAGTFLPGDPAPSLTVAEQFARDMTDGNLDLVDVDGCSIAAAPSVGGICPADRAGNLAYTYETLWRGNTIATNATSRRAGDATLAARNPFVAVYRIAAKRAYQSCSFARGPAVCDPLLRVTTSGQTVRLDASGRLTLERGSSAAFGDQLRFISRETGPIQIPGEFVEVKVGSRGEVIALKRNRQEFVYIDPLQLYEVTGRETLTGDNLDLPANADVLTQALRNIQTRVIGLADTERVANFTPSPVARVYKDDSDGVAPAFLYVLTNGNLRAVRPAVASGSFEARWGAPLQSDLPAPAPLASVVYDKFAPPGHDAVYGPAPSQSVAQPYGGPRRLYGLTRTGQVRVWLEGASASGRVLAIPGRVVQIAAEGRTSIYALTGDGKVFWLNADQAHDTTATLIDARVQASFPRRFGLDTVQPIALSERVCWLARNEAVACGTGNVYSWNEDLIEIGQTPFRFDACGVAPVGTIAAGTVDVIPVGRGISAAVKVPLSDATGSIWRLNAADEFGYERRGSFREVCRVDGLRYLGVNGTVVDEAGAQGKRSITGTTVRFPNGDAGGFDARFITGKQLRTALESATAALAIGPRQLASTGPIGFTGAIQMQALGGQQVISHVSSVRSDPQGGGAVIAQIPRPDVTAVGRYSSANGTTSLSFDTVRDDSNRRVVALAGAPRSFADGDNIALNVVPLGEWQFADQQAGCTGCIDERGQSRLWQVMVLPTTDSEDEYGFRVCLRIRVEQSSTADIRFACTKHDNDGAFVGISMTDRVLRNDGRLDLIDFMHF